MNDQAWTPRRGAPAAREGESREQYTKRIRAERNRRHRESVKERALAASPAGKVAAAAAKPARTRTNVQARVPGSEPAYLPASVLTNTGHYTFDTADPDEYARIEAILRSEPGLEQVDPRGKASRRVQPCTRARRLEHSGTEVHVPGEDTLTVASCCRWGKYLGCGCLRPVWSGRSCWRALLSWMRRAG